MVHPLAAPCLFLFCVPPPNLPLVALSDVVGVVVVRCAVCCPHLCRRRVPIGSQQLRGFLYGASARASPRLSPGFADCMFVLFRFRVFSFLICLFASFVAAVFSF